MHFVDTIIVSCKDEAVMLKIVLLCYSLTLHPFPDPNYACDVPVCKLADGAIYPRDITCFVETAMDEFARQYPQ